MSETQQADTAYRQREQFEDEIELMDYLRVIWKWKYLIVAGTLICAVAAGVISFLAPKIYRFDLVLQPGILSVERGGRNVYVDSPQNIKAVIEAGTFNQAILRNISGSNNNLPQSIEFKADIPKKGTVVKVSHETSDVETGLQVLNQLGELLLKEYSERVAYFQNEYETQVNLKQTEMAQLELEKSALVKHINNLEERISELRSEIKSIRENMASLIQKQDKFLSKNTNEGNTTSAVFYTTAMQQNIALENSYRLEINDFASSQEQEKLRIEEIAIQERILLEEIEGFKSKMNNIQNIKILQPPSRSAYPIKPKIKLNVMLAGIVGLFGMLILAFLMEYIQRHKGKLES